MVITLERKPKRSRSKSAASPSIGKCPICGGRKFKSYRGRDNEKCEQCGSKERTRAHFLFLSRMKFTCLDKPFYHISPERAISKKLIDIFWEQYRPVDIMPDKFISPVPVKKLDMTADLADLPEGSVGGFFHSHVLEHVAAPIGEVFTQMNRAIASGGVHFFCIPMKPGTYEEDISPDLSEAERIRRFGQDNHVRRIGKDDFETRFIDRYFGDFERIRPHDLVPQAEARKFALHAKSPEYHKATFIFRKK